MWVVEKVQPSHCSAAGVPHLEVGDQLGPTVEDVDQRHRPVGTDQLRGRIDFGHGQAASLRAQRIAGAGVRLLLDAEFVDPRLPRRPVGDLRHGMVARCGLCHSWFLSRRFGRRSDRTGTPWINQLGSGQILFEPVSVSGGWAGR
jgi:hypothetical protein